MRNLTAALLIVVGVINFLPVIGVLGSARLAGLYGLSFDEPNLAILMRHRALLLGMLGAVLVVAAFRRHLQNAAIVGGFVSMGAFVALATMSPSCNPQLSRVVNVDLFALVCLLAAAVARGFSPQQSEA